MSPETTVTFPSEDAILEGRLSIARPGMPALVICHPHPEYGGSMDNNVVFAVRDAAASLGFTTLRFNFRGVGRSGGSATGQLLDARDVAAAVDFITGHPEAAPQSVWVAGYSYGSWVGLFFAMADTRIAGWIAVSPPVGLFDFSYLMDSAVPKLVIYGDSDYFVSAGELRQLFDRLSDPKRLVTVQGADHFYWGQETVVMDKVGQFLRQNTEI